MIIDSVDEKRAQMLLEESNLLVLMLSWYVFLPAFGGEGNRHGIGMKFGD